MTEREDDEVLVAVTFDAPKGGYAYEKQKRKIGDYATAAAAVIISKDGSVCKGASIAMTNLSDTPIFCTDSSNSLVGTSVTAEDIKKAVNEMIEAIDPAEDNRGPVEFKKHAASVVLTRAIKSAWERA
jgi:carbon-monoxide dehydrogenase medium subunit